MQIKFILYIYTYLYILFLKFFLLLKRQVNITWYIPREMFSYWSNVKKNFESIANLVKYKYEWKGFKILEFFQWKKKKKFRNSYHYFEARKAWTQRKKLSSALRGGCISKGATISKREGKFGLSVGQFHRAVNNDISEGMVGYRNFGSPLDWGNDRTRRWTALSLSLPLRPIYLSSRHPSLPLHTPTDRSHDLFVLIVKTVYLTSNISVSTGKIIELWNLQPEMILYLIERMEFSWRLLRDLTNNLLKIFFEIYIFHIYIYTFSSHIVPYSRTD